ncbi:hypothetical protein DIPPA_07464 [Diplonema papillatum]|nr:hypothetical protein DIPPA_07464 [Diplonema papillatum]
MLDCVALTEATAPSATAILEDEQNARYLSGFGKQWKQQVRLLVKRGLDGGSMWAVLLEGCVVGVVMVEWLDRECGSVSFEYIVDHRHWGKGYGTQAARHCVSIARDRLRAKQAVAMIVPANEASVKIATRLGFTKSHTAAYSLNGGDRVTDYYQLSLTADIGENCAAQLDHHTRQSP